MQSCVGDAAIPTRAALAWTCFLLNWFKVGALDYAKRGLGYEDPDVRVTILHDEMVADIYPSRGARKLREFAKPINFSIDPMFAGPPVVGPTEAADLQRAWERAWPDVKAWTDLVARRGYTVDESKIEDLWRDLGGEGG